MKKLIMLTSMSGPTLALMRGDEHECEDDEAGRLVKAGFARFAESDAERAKREASEQAAAEKAAAEQDKPATKGAAKKG